MLKYDSTNMFSPQIGELSIKKEDLFLFKNSLFDKNLLTFRNLIFNDTENIKSIAKNIISKYKNYVVVGIGGSDLGSRTIQQSFKSISGVNVLFIGANTDPNEIEDFFKKIDIKDTLFNVISKSGETIEIIANFLYITEVIENKKEKVSDHIVITTSTKNTTLESLAKNYGIDILEGDASVGDRFSVLSIIGLLTAAVMGLDIDKFLEGAVYIDKITNSEDPFSNEVLMFAELQYLSYKNFNKNISILMPYSKKLERFGFWYRQLVAESLGKKVSKQGKNIFAGITPIASLGSTDQHSQIQLYNEGPNDKIITFIIPSDFESDIKINTEIENVKYLNGLKFEDLIKKEFLATSISLKENNRSHGTIHIDKIDEFNIGALFYFFELSTAYLGEMLNIDTFDQPGVEKGKEYMYALLGKKGFEEQKKHLSKYIDER